MKFLREQRVVGGKYQKWIAKLLDYDFVIEYENGLENKVADVLLRLPPALELDLLSVVRGLNTSVFIDQVNEHEFLNTIQLSLLNGQQAPAGIMARGRYCVTTVAWSFLMIHQPFPYYWLNFIIAQWRSIMVH